MTLRTPCGSSDPHNVRTNSMTGDSLLCTVSRQAAGVTKTQQSVPGVAVRNIGCYSPFRNGTVLHRPERRISRNRASSSAID